MRPGPVLLVPARRYRASLLCAAVWMWAAGTVWPATAAGKELTPYEARNHVGESATVCGEVVSTEYAESSKGRPTLINLDEPYPRQVFTIVIWGEDRPKFAQAPERAYDSKRLCVTGSISSFQGVAQIEVDDPESIDVVTSRQPPIEPPARNCTPRSQCCKVCSKGKACGNTCISRSYTCHKGRGCACDAWELC